MNFKELLKSKLTELAELKEKLAAGEDVQEQISATMDEIDGLKAKIKAAERASALLSSVGTKDSEGAGAGGEKSAKTLGEHFVKNMPENRSKRFNISAPDFKAYNDPMAVGTVASPQVPRALVTDIDRNIVTEVIAATYLRSLFGSEQISGNALTFFVEGALETQDARPYGFGDVNEGASKPQISFADPTPVTVSLEKIAAFIKETDEYIEDTPFLASAINGRLLNYLRLTEEAKLLSKLSGTSGIQTDTTNWHNTLGAQGIADLIFKKIQAVQAQSGFAADAIIMHPTVWQTLRLGKDSDNRYFGGGYFADGQGKQLWGIPVYTSTFVDAPVAGSATGTIWVGAFRACGSVVSKGGVTVEATNTDQDDFIKNRMTIRAEERIALAVRRPAGFVKITKAATDPS